MRNLFNELESFDFRLPNSINTMKDLTFQKYFSTHIHPKESPWFDTFLVALRQTLREDNCGIKQVEKIIAEFKIAKAIQLADGAYTLFDDLVFQNNILFANYLDSVNLTSGISQQCSTIRMIQHYSPLTGPGIINEGCERFSVFGLSKKKMMNSNMCAVGPVQYSKNIAHYFELNERSLLDIQFKTAADAIGNLNNTLWGRLNEVPLVYFIHERLTQILTAKFLCEKNELLIDLLFNSYRREKLFEKWDSLIKSGKVRFLRRTADFFYLRSSSSIEPTKLKLEHLVNLKGNKVYNFELNGIIQGLEDGVLFPNLMISYLVLSMIPGILAFGGASQNEYFFEIINILEETFGHDCFSKLVSPSVKELNVFFAGIVSPNRYPKDHRTKKEFFELYRKIKFDFMNTPIQELIGNGHQFSYFKFIQSRSENIKNNLD